MQINPILLACALTVTATVSAYGNESMRHASDYIQITTSPSSSSKVSLLGPANYVVSPKKSSNVMAHGEQSLDVFYAAPLCRQFYGLSSDGHLLMAPMAIEFYPVYSPLTWSNLSENTDTGISYLWQYKTSASDTTQETLANDLTTSFRPDYSTPATCRNNFFNLPSLTASAPGMEDATYGGEAACLQAGGTAEYEMESGMTSFGLLPFSIDAEGLGIYVKEPVTPGGEPVPVFGYSADHDAWWDNYTFNGAPDPGEFAYVTGYMNWIQMSEKPLVVKGATATAIGRVKPEANFRLEVRPVADDGEIVEEIVAVAHLSGTDVIVIPNPDNPDMDILSLNFVFDTPVEMDPSEYPAGYLVEVTGYHDGGVEYFAPLQSIRPNPYEYCLGFYRHHRRFNGVEDDSYSFCAFFENENGELYTTFAIGLDAVSPWVDPIPDNSVVIDSIDPVEVQFGGYYSGEEYSIMAPEWLEVEVSGRYDNTIARFTPLTTSDVERKATVVLMAPGIVQRFKVTCAPISGLDLTAAPTDKVAPLYNAQGILIDPAVTVPDIRNLPSGLYIHAGKKVLVR